MPQRTRSLSARRLDISDWLSTLTPATLTHYAGILVGLILMVRGGLGGIYYSSRYRSKKKIDPRVQVGRMLYLFVGFFLVAVELLYFLFGIDWFHKSLLR